MRPKRALIVDDSKSACVFLARMLEKYALQVDVAASAEEAIQYLNSQRPDVIFMDHQMPGMDGLQAVQIIKNNPRTAMIPIMMYTSQEGELYLGQARALGAIGVLPKQIKPADVSKVLYELHLLPDRRQGEQTTFKAAAIDAAGAAANAESRLVNSGEAPSAHPIDLSMLEQFAELRRSVSSGVESQMQRLLAELRRGPADAALEQAPEQASRARTGYWLLTALALAVASLSALLWWRTLIALETLGTELGQLQREAASREAAQSAAVAALQADLTALRVEAAAARSQEPAVSAEVGASEGALRAGVVSATGPARAAGGELRPLVLPVPYGMEAFSGQRLEAIRGMLYRLRRSNVSGLVEIKTFAGRFCLLGSAVEGYSLAPDETPYAKCDLVGNPAEEALSASQRTPVTLANLIGEIRQSTRGALEVQTALGEQGLAMAYPPVTTTLTAGEWNRAAAANNRIEVRLR